MESREAVREALARINPKFSALLVLRYIEGLSYEEIAQQLDIPLGTVKAQLFRAREFLHNVLKNVEGKI